MVLNSQSCCLYGQVAGITNLPQVYVMLGMDQGTVPGPYTLPVSYILTWCLLLGWVTAKDQSSPPPLFFWGGCEWNPGPQLCLEVLYSCSSPRHLHFLFFHFEVSSCYVSLVDLKLRITLLQPPE